MPPHQLGDMIRELRDRKGWTQRDLAAKAMVTPAYVAMLESGTKQNPSLPVLRRLERALGSKHGQLEVLFRLPREWWRPEASKEISGPPPLRRRGPYFATREEAEAEARRTRQRYVARYQDKPGGYVRRPFPVREEQ
jgi:transcriptional regulator with XRE-family HTH domain